MSRDAEDIALLKLKLDLALDALDRSGADASGASVSLPAVTTTITTYPTVPFAYYAVVAAALGGLEVEGTAGTVSPAKDKFVAVNLGSAIPPVGTNVIISRVGSRWAFRWDG